MLRPLYRTDEIPSASCLTASDIPASNQPLRDSCPQSNLNKRKRSLRKIRHRALTQCPGEHAFFYLQYTVDWKPSKSEAESSRSSGKQQKEPALGRDGMIIQIVPACPNFPTYWSDIAFWQGIENAYHWDFCNWLREGAWSITRLWSRSFGS